MPGSARVDLHVHSTCSDGLLSPAGLAEHASALGLIAIALSDHDSVEGIPACAAACERLGLVCIPAVELSTRSGSCDAHVLGYFVDVGEPCLLAELARLREGRERRIASMTRRLGEGGLPVDFDDVLALADGGSVGRAHLARVLVGKGYAEDLPDAFQRLIGRGKPFWEPSQLPTPAEAIRTIRAAGGLPVIAHPALSGCEALIEPLAGEGLAGVEAYHAEHSREQALRLDALAQELGLLVTGGSDYHGPDRRTPEMGSVELPEGAYEALLRAAGR